MARLPLAPSDKRCKLPVVLVATRLAHQAHHSILAEIEQLCWSAIEQFSQLRRLLVGRDENLLAIRLRLAHAAEERAVTLIRRTLLQGLVEDDEPWMICLE